MNENSTPEPRAAGVGGNGLMTEMVHELKSHAPFTLMGGVLGVIVLVTLSKLGLPRGASAWLFDVLHPLHVLVSAIVTTAIYRLHGRRGLVATVLVGYVGAVGIGTLSDCLIPYWGEWLLDMPHRHAHIGFIEHWWLVNPLALVGIAIAVKWPRTKMPHATHVLLSTWASLFHMAMAADQHHMEATTLIVVPVFLFLAVWVPCCTSDIVFPMFFSGGRCDIRHCHHDDSGTDHEHR